MISIIIPFHKGKIYLEDCLESIAEQTYKDVETILVQDAIDGIFYGIDEETQKNEAFENIDDFIEKYKKKINLKYYKMEKHCGVAAARNIGLKKATGEYVFFLDSDDYLTSDFLDKLIQGMEQDKGMDLAYGNVIRTWFKKAAFRVEQGDIPEKGEAEKSMEEREKEFKNIAENMILRHEKIDTISCLGIVFRKDFLTRNQICFTEYQKYFADSDFMAKVLKAEPKYIAVPDSYYVKRYHNDKVKFPALSQIENKEKEELMRKAYLDVFEVLENNELLEHFRKRLCKFYINVFSRRFHDNPKNQPTRQDIEYYSEVLKQYQANKTKGLGLFEKKIIRYGCEQNLLKVKKWANIRLAKNKVFLMFTDIVHIRRTINLYIFQKMKVKQNYIIFESFVGRNYSGQPKYIYQYLQNKYGDKYKYIWSVRDKKIEIDGKCKKVKRFRIGYYYYLTRSKYWVFNTRQPMSIKKRKGQVLLETWHGTPLKKLFFDMDEVHSADPEYKQSVYKQSREWDYLLSDNPFSTEKFQSCFMYEKDKILEAGYPANDPLYDANIDRRAIELKKKMGIPLDKKVLLYAPTWRDDDRYDAGEYRFRLELDLERLKREFGDTHVVLLRMHYWVVDRLDLSGMEDFVIDVSNYSDITDVYIVSDICMTDYSSVFFDFANLKRPILFFMYDLEKYRDVLRGFYLDIEKDMPGPILLTNDEIVEALKNMDKVTEEYSKRYQEFYDRFCCIDDGEAAKRVCETVFDNI